MEIRLQDGGRVWVSGQAPYWSDWRGKQAYKFYVAAQRAREAHATRTVRVASDPVTA